MRHYAQGAQWTLYLLASVVLGLLWLVPFSMAGFNEVPRDQRLTTVWLAAAGLLVGLQFRIAGKGPSRAFALWVPAVGAITRSAVLAVLDPFASVNDFFQDAFAGLVFGYTCGGFLVLPLAFAHVWLLREIHECLNVWSARAEPRSVRRGWYAIASLALIGVSELPRRLEGKLFESASTIGRQTGFPLPSDATLVRAYPNPLRVRRCWVRARNLQWPEQVLTTPLEKIESQGNLVRRLRREVGDEAAKEVLDVTQRKWIGYERYGEVTYTGRLVHTPSDDYLEITIS
jgi:hypothetical protein